MEIKGMVKAVLQPRSGNGPRGPWKSQTVVVEYWDGNYPVKLALTNTRNADQFGRLREGGVYTFKVCPRSKEHNSNWFTEVNCYAWQDAQPAAARPAAPDAGDTQDGGIPY